MLKTESELLERYGRCVPQSKSTELMKAHLFQRAIMIDHPYLKECEARMSPGDKLKTIPMFDENWRHHETEVTNVGSIQSMTNDLRSKGALLRSLTNVRRELVAKYAWSILSIEALDEIAKLGPLLSVGAGSGYNESLLAQMGVDVLAFDNFAAEELWTQHWHPIGNKDAVSVASKHYERALFLSWPTYGDKWALDAVKAYRTAGGKTVAYVGEERGCCGTDELFDEFDDHWDAQHISIPQWEGLCDYMSIFTVK